MLDVLRSSEIRVHCSLFPTQEILQNGTARSRRRLLGLDGGLCLLHGQRHRRRSYVQVNKQKQTCLYFFESPVCALPRNLSVSCLLSALASSFPTSRNTLRRGAGRCPQFTAYKWGSPLRRVSIKTKQCCHAEVK